MDCCKVYRGRDIDYVAVRLGLSASVCSTFVNVDGLADIASMLVTCVLCWVAGRDIYKRHQSVPSRESSISQYDPAAIVND